MLLVYSRPQDAQTAAILEIAVAFNPSSMSRVCVRTAFTLYGEILDAVEAAHYHVLTERVSVPMTRRTLMRPA